MKSSKWIYQIFVLVLCALILIILFNHHFIALSPISQQKVIVPSHESIEKSNKNDNLIINVPMFEVTSNIIDICDYNTYSAPNNYKFIMCLRKKGYISMVIRRSGKWKDCANLPFIFQHLVKFNINSNNNETKYYFFDIGANIGSCSFTMSVQKHIKNLNIISFEPLQSNIFYFTNTMIANRFTNIRLIKCGASNEGYLANKKIFVPMRNAGGATIEHKKGMDEVFHAPKEGVYEEEICVTTIDYIINQMYKQNAFNKNTVIPLMKIDIEGFEYFALKGAKHLLTNDSFGSIAPWVIKFEYTPWHIQHKSINLIDLFKLIESYGYNIYSKFNLNGNTNKCLLCPFNELMNTNANLKITDPDYLKTLPKAWGIDLYAVRKSIVNAK